MSAKDGSEAPLGDGDALSPGNVGTGGTGRSVVLVALVVGAVTLARLVWLAIMPFDLYGDEAYYWHWSRELAFGYYSKPPMVAWVIAGTTAIGGNAEFWVRLGSPLLYAATSLVVFSIGRRLYGDRTGLVAGAFFVTLPAVFVGGMVISTDAPLLFFWALALRAFIEAVHSNRWRWWVLTGVAGGLGMLSKYTMGVAALSCLLFLVLDPERRAYLRNPRLWGGAAIALLVFLPNLVWNAENGFVSVLHLKHNADLGRDLVHPIRLLEFLAAHVALLGPVLFGVAVLLLVGLAGNRTTNPADRLLFWFVVPMLALIGLLAFLSRAYANWAVPALVAATIWASAWLVRTRRWRLLWAGIAANLVLGLAVYGYEPVIQASGFTPNSRADPFKRLRGWREAAEQLRPALRRHPNARLLGDDRIVLAQMVYYTRPLAVESAAVWNPTARTTDHYELATDIRADIGGDFIYVTERKKPPPGMRQAFAHVRPLQTIRVPMCADVDRRVNVLLLNGFRGYARRDTARRGQVSADPLAFSAQTTRITTGVNCRTDRVRHPDRPQDIASQGGLE